MAYRPQFAYPRAPEGSRDEPYEYFFDQTNEPALMIDISPGQQIEGIPLPLDADAEFRARAIQIGNAATLSAPLGIRLRDGLGNYLSKEYVPIQFFCGYTGSGDFEGGEACALEPELICPAGGSLSIDICNLQHP